MFFALNFHPNYVSNWRCPYGQFFLDSRIVELPLRLHVSLLAALSFGAPHPSRARWAGCSPPPRRLTKTRLETPAWRDIPPARCSVTETAATPPPPPPSLHSPGPPLPRETQESSAETTAEERSLWDLSSKSLQKIFRIFTFKTFQEALNWVLG